MKIKIKKLKKIHNHLHLYIFNLPWFIWEKVSILIPRPPPPTSNLFFFFFPSAYNHYLLQQPAGNCFFAFIDKSSTGQRSIATTAVKSTTPPYLVTKWTSITPSISTSFIFYFISFFFFFHSFHYNIYNCHDWWKGGSLNSHPSANPGVCKYIQVCWQ